MPNDLEQFGQRLVAELSKGADADMTLRWMAHYLAELLTDAKQADPPRKLQASADAAKLIFQIWRYREHMPGANRPFRDYKKVCEVLRGLSRDSKAPFYYRETGNENSESTDLIPSDLWLRAIRSIDRSARTMIQFCVQHATEHASESGVDWLQSSKIACLRDDRAMIVVRTILYGLDAPSVADERSEQDKKLAEALQVIDEFTSVARLLRAEVQQSLLKSQSAAEACKVPPAKMDPKQSEDSRKRRRSSPSKRPRHRAGLGKEKD